MKISTKLSLAMITASLFSTSNLHAAISMAVAEPTGTVRTDNYPYAGYGFFLPIGASIPVNQLGYWDQGGDGLANSHTVSVFKYIDGTNKSYTLVASATVPAGTSATLEGGFRWVNLPEITLTEDGQGGNYYVIMASHGVDAWTSGPSTGITMNSSFGTITTAGALDFGGGVNANEINNSAGTVFGGANFGYSAIPEPSIVLTGGLSLLAFSFTRRRKSV